MIVDDSQENVVACQRIRLTDDHDHDGEQGGEEPPQSVSELELVALVIDQRSGNAGPDAYCLIGTGPSSAAGT